ncbi:MAG: RnfABCDGE type electron transport complex subunit B, partial [Actinomycetota bacterium]|nr:RnfABCDGE type electron transport complex subunit B [Actinomycetota bacterium]
LWGLRICLVFEVVVLDIMLVLKASLALGGLALLFGALLAIASVRFKVDTDPRIDEVRDVLLGSNCGACGYPGCQKAAEAVVKGKASVDVCVAGGERAAEEVARIMGVSLTIHERGVALVHCKGGFFESVPKAKYEGINSCTAAEKIAGGSKACEYGCLGLGSCKEACPVNAIIIDPDGRRWVNRERCTGCGLCVEVCPRGLIQIVPRWQEVLVVCNNRDKGSVARRICTVCCTACKKCEKACEAGAIEVKDNRAWIIYEKCTQCGKCIDVCPNNVIVRVVPAPVKKGKEKILPAESIKS